MDKTITGAGTGAPPAGATTTAAVTGFTDSAATDSIDDAGLLVVCVTGEVGAVADPVVADPVTTEVALTAAVGLLSSRGDEAAFVCGPVTAAEPFELEPDCSTGESGSDGDVPAVVLDFDTDAEASPAADDVSPAPIAPPACC